MIERPHARFDGLLRLRADIDGARGVLADQHHGEAGLHIVLACEPLRFCGDTRAQLRGDRLAVDDACRHVGDSPPSFRPSEARAGIHKHNSRESRTGCGYGFRARRGAAPRNDGNGYYPEPASFSSAATTAGPSPTILSRLMR